MPILMITGQKPIKKSKQGQFQILKIVEMMRPITKYTKSIVEGNTVPYLVREVFRVAEEERPGAVHLELPEDIAAEEVDAQVLEVSSTYRPNAPTRVCLDAARLIEQAKHPLILVGAGANRKRTSEALCDFIKKSGIYFFNTQMGKGVVDESNELFLGTAALSEHDYIHCAIDRADLIINMGHDVIEKPPFFMRPGGPKVIHVNFFSAHMDEVYFPQVEVLGDIADNIRELTKHIEPQPSWDFSYFERIRSEIDNNVYVGSDDDRFPVLPQRLVSDVRKVMPKDSILALDNGMYKIWFARNYKAYEPNTVLLDNALASMGAGLPSAMAAAMVYPNKKVVAVCGDGGFMMNSQDMETAVRLKLNLTILLLRDNGYGMIKWKQATMHFNDFGLDYGNPDFVKYAESYGASGYRLEKADDLIPMLTHCNETPGVHLIDVPIDYSENVRHLNEELLSKTCLLYPPFLLSFRPPKGIQSTRKAV